MVQVGKNRHFINLDVVFCVTWRTPPPPGEDEVADRLEMTAEMWEARKAKEIEPLDHPSLNLGTDRPGLPSVLSPAIEGASDDEDEDPLAIDEEFAKEEAESDTRLVSELFRSFAGDTAMLASKVDGGAQGGQLLTRRADLFLEAVAALERHQGCVGENVRQSLGRLVTLVRSKAVRSGHFFGWMEDLLWDLVEMAPSATALSEFQAI